MSSYSIRATLPLLAAAALAASACSSDSPTSPPPPLAAPTITLSIVAGDGQAAMVGDELSIAPTVVARTETGALAPGVRVMFAIDRGGGHLAGSASTIVLTDVAGRASARWTLGAEIGVNMLRVALADVASATPLFFTAVANAPEIRTPGILLTSLSNVGEVGTFLSPPLATLTDAQGKPMVGIAVTFTVVTGGGSLTGEKAITDAEGHARVGSWRLGTVAGPQTIAADAPGLTRATLTVEAMAGAPVELRIFEGDGQTATVMSRVPIAPAVKLVDRYGNGVPRAEMFFKVGGESGAFVFTPFERTDSHGIARTAGWNLGVRPGDYTLTVSVQTAPTFTVRFTATAVVGAPAALRIVEGNNQIAPAGSKLPIAPAVQVTDTWGNPVAIAGVVVIFTPRGSSGTVAGGEAVTDAEGIARVESWTIGPLTTESGNLLSAEAAGLRGTSFQATGT